MSPLRYISQKNEKPSAGSYHPCRIWPLYVYEVSNTFDYYSPVFCSSKSHIHLSLLTLFRRIYPMPHVIFCMILQCGLSAHHPTCELEDHPLSVAHDYVLNSFPAIRPLSMCHPMCHGIMIILILNTEWAETFRNSCSGWMWRVVLRSTLFL